MAGVVNNKKGTPVTQAALLSARRALAAPAVTFGGFLVSHRPPPSKAARVTESPLLAAVRPPASTGVRTVQSPTLAAVNFQGNIKVRVTQAAMLVAWKTGVPGQTRQRAWTFDFDGHNFYVLDLGPEGTWVLDLTTQQWSKFETPGYGVWNFLNGFAWESNRMVVGGDSILSTIYRLDPKSAYDDGWRPIDYKVTGGISTADRRGKSIDSVRLVVSAGYVADPMPTIKMRFSDDAGATWSDYYTYQMEKANYTQRIEWNSLGQMDIPGRVFEFYDQGGLVRIDSADVQVDGQD